MPRWASQESKANRDRKKNITIQFDTWERLKSFGKMGDTFDDVLNRLMDTSVKHSEIQRLQQPQQQDKNIENVNVSAGVVSSRAGSAADTLDKGLERPQQQVPRNQQSYSNMFNKDTVIPLQGDEYELMLWMPALKLPMNKDKLIQYAKRLEKKYEEEAPLFFIKTLPETNKVYRDLYQLEEGIIEGCNNNQEIIADFKFWGGGRGMMAGCRIIVDDDKKVFLDKFFTEARKREEIRKQRNVQPGP